MKFPAIDGLRRVVGNVVTDLSEARTPTVDVALLGPRGSGKTSLIAAMYSQLEPAARQAALQLRVDTMSEVKLNDMCERLLRCANGSVVPDNAVPGTMSAQRYHFTLVETRVGGAHVPALRFDFVDFPGDWIEFSRMRSARDGSPESGRDEGTVPFDFESDEDERENRQLAIEALCGASIIIIAVDAPYLMDGVKRIGYAPHRLHYDRNRPDLIEGVLRESLGLAIRPRLVLLVPVRGEKWALTGGGRVAMTEATKAGYSGVLNFLASGNLSEWVTVVVTPVMTTGCLVFDGWIESETDPLPRPSFAVSSPGGFEPAFCDQPIYHMLRFAAEEYRRQRRSSFGQALKYLADNDTMIHRSSAIFADKCLERDGFQILQRGTLR